MEKALKASQEQLVSSSKANNAIIWNEDDFRRNSAVQQEKREEQHVQQQLFGHVGGAACMASSLERIDGQIGSVNYGSPQKWGSERSYTGVSDLGKPPPARMRSLSDGSDRQRPKTPLGKPPLVQPRTPCLSSTPPPMTPNTVFRKNLAAIMEDGNNSLMGDTNSSLGRDSFHKRGIDSSDDYSFMSQSTYASVGNTDSLRSWELSERMERIERFQAEQNAKFEENKKTLEQKFSRVFDKDDGGDQATNKKKDELINIYMQELEKERCSLIEQWKAELRGEEDDFLIRCGDDNQDPKRRLFKEVYEVCLRPYIETFLTYLAALEVFICNMPLTIGALGLCWVSMGVVWFKFMEVELDACVPVHYFSSLCHIHEFPACFSCDETNISYRIALQFHYMCTSIALMCCTLFVLKCIFAWKAVIDELRNPVTSTPCGVFCMAMVSIFAGQGMIGEIVVVGMSISHLLLAFWFLYIAVNEYRLWPDPGWFPNTIGIAYAAVKAWLYCPVFGRILLLLCIIFFIGTFFISVIRVASNRKIAAPVCWIQLSGPSITLFALSLITQPSKKGEELLENYPASRDTYNNILQQLYIPFEHLLMFLSFVGLVSAVHALWIRRDQLLSKPFSPAHIAFCFPTLSHANAVQSYRAAINTYLKPINQIEYERVASLQRFLFAYWIAFLLVGTILTIVFTIIFVSRLCEWTKAGTLEDEELATEDKGPPSSPSIIHDLLEDNGAHEVMFFQPFVSPAVLEANEVGSLVRLQRGTEAFRRHGPYVRTRKISALGFDFTLDENELRQERAQLLQWVATKKPKKRNRTWSNIFEARRPNVHDASNRGAYGTFTAAGATVDNDGTLRRSRSKTAINGVSWL